MNIYTSNSGVIAASGRYVLPAEFAAQVLYDEFLTPMAIDAADLAHFISIEPWVIEQIIDQRAGITSVLADRLSIRFGLSETFWSDVQMKYDANMPSFQELEHRLHQMVKQSSVE